MPTDPNARGNSILSDILKAVNKGNDLLAAQNKILDKMERHARPTVITHHPYLDRSESGTGPGANHQEGDAGSAGTLQGGDPSSAR